MDKDKRKRLRINFSAQTKLIDKENGNTYSVSMTDISMNGLSGTSDGIPFKSGQSCDVEIIIPGRASRLILEISGRIARIENETVAVEFDNDLEWWAIFSIYKPYGGKENEGVVE